MKSLALFGAAVCLAISAQGDSAATFGFNNISGGDTFGDALVGNFSLELDVGSPTEVIVKILSAANPGATYFIGQIFVDDDPSNVLTGEATAFSTANSTGYVNLEDNGTANMPQGNVVGFDTTQAYVRATGGQANSGNVAGVQQGEVAWFKFGGIYADVLAALNAGTLRFGLHVQGIDDGTPDGKSDAFVTAAVPPPPAVPVPASAPLLVAGVGALLALRRRKA